MKISIQLWKERSLQGTRDLNSLFLKDISSTAYLYYLTKHNNIKVQRELIVVCYFHLLPTVSFILSFCTGKGTVGHSAARKDQRSWIQPLLYTHLILYKLGTVEILIGVYVD